MNNPNALQEPLSGPAPPPAEVAEPPAYESRRAAVDEVSHSISRLAVLHELPQDLQAYDYPFVPQHEFSNRATSHTLGRNYRMQRGFETELPRDIDRSPDSMEKSNVLQTVGAEIMVQAFYSMGVPEAGQEQSLNWRSVSEGLLHGAAHTEDPAQREKKLVGAVLSSQFSENSEDRQAFIRQVYDQGLEAEVAAACAGSHLVLIIDSPLLPARSGEAHTHTVHPLREFAPAFEIDHDRLLNYLAHMPRGATSEVPEGLPSAKKLHKELVAQAEEAEADEATRTAAAHVSLNGEKVGGSVLDMYKVERFALQGLFIKEQAKLFFGASTEELVNSGFARQLATTRDKGSSVIDERLDITGSLEAMATDAPYFLVNACAALENDVEQTFIALSEPLVRRFSLDGVDTSSPEQLTPEQRASLRYRTVIKHMEQHKVLAQYLDFEAFVERDDVEIAADPLGEELWTLSEAGAAIPSVCNLALSTVLDAAMEAERQGVRMAPSELYELMQGDRRTLLGIATQNIAELQNTSAPLANVKVSRDEDGRLLLHTTASTPPKESLDVYAAVTLGCPALREIHESRKMLSVEQRLAHGSSNYIDHILATVFAEARERHMFDLRTYGPPPNIAA